MPFDIREHKVAERRMSRKEVLNQPGPSELFAMRASIAVDWAKEHFRYILYGILGLIVIIAIVVAWSSWQRHRRGTASVMLHQALKLVNPDADAKEAANPDEALKQLQAITEGYGRTPAGARAYWHLGHLYFSQGKIEDALKAYDVARRRLPNQQSLSTTLAILNMGYAQETADACGDAITSYESVQQSPIQWLRGEAYLGMGRCHEKAGDTDKAIVVYDRAMADVYVTDNAQQTISERLARLQPDELEAPAAPTEENPSSSGVEPKATEAEADVRPSNPEPEAPGEQSEAEKPVETDTQPVNSESATSGDQPKAEKSSTETSASPESATSDEQPDAEKPVETDAQPANPESATSGDQPKAEEPAEAPAIPKMVDDKPDAMPASSDGAGAQQTNPESAASDDDRPDDVVKPSIEVPAAPESAGDKPADKPADTTQNVKN